MTLINIDQAPRQRRLDENTRIITIFISAMIAFMVFCAAASTYAVMRVADTSIGTTAYDYSVSPELHSYLNSSAGRGQFVTESGLE